MLSCLIAQEYETCAGNVKKYHEIWSVRKHDIQKMFQPRWDEIGRKVGVLSNEKFGDSFMSSDMWKNATETVAMDWIWSSRREQNSIQNEF